ncbi:MAG: NADH-quinone oxidoreductase subunit NuoK [Desulfuromonadales bacterium]|jgi:NADH-quinone oxidoreductase subunit K|nr:NADH-quinone oxidoreductase subunit NuoK [Desulfuromonadales bacterium]MDZ4184046.1 NADH-quinone oxidoreductase subunit NuoK [Desulfuromonadales bacterium]
MISVNYFLVLSAILFSLGVFGVLTRKNSIVVFMCIELMLNAVNLTFIALSRHLGNMDGQVFVLFVMAVAAAEAAVGLALMITFFRNRESLDIDDANTLKW